MARDLDPHLVGVGDRVRHLVALEVDHVRLRLLPVLAQFEHLELAAERRELVLEVVVVALQAPAQPVVGDPLVRDRVRFAPPVEAVGGLCAERVAVGIRRRGGYSRISALLKTRMA